MNTLNGPVITPGLWVTECGRFVLGRRRHFPATGAAYQDRHWSVWSIRVDVNALLDDAGIADERFATRRDAHQALQALLASHQALREFLATLPTPA